jgi:hypothetical protein
MSLIDNLIETLPRSTSAWKSGMMDAGVMSAGTSRTYDSIAERIDPRSLNA